MVKIAIIGFGVVGSGVYEIIRKNKQVLTKKAGEEIPQLVAKQHEDYCEYVLQKA